MLGILWVDAWRLSALVKKAEGAFVQKKAALGIEPVRRFWGA